MKQNDLMTYATPGERSSAKALVRASLATDTHVVSVNDGVEWVVKQSRSTTAIFDALASTGADVIRVLDTATGRTAWFELVWGNAPSGEELVSDYSDNEMASGILDAIIDAGTVAP